MLAHVGRCWISFVRFDFQVQNFDTISFNILGPTKFWMKLEWFENFTRHYTLIIIHKCSVSSQSSAD
jgi:hypothetical protein